MSRLSRRLILLSAFVAACGGGSDDGPTGNNGNAITGDGNITMTVNGQSWRSVKASDRVTKGTNNFYGVSAFNPPYNLILGIGNLTAPGSVNLDLSSGGNGSSAIVSTASQGFGTAFTGGSGTIVVTTLTANRIAGTFSFNAVTGNNGTVLQVRNGTFDVTF